MNGMHQKYIQGASKKTEFSGKQLWQIQLLCVGNTVGLFLINPDRAAF